MKTIIKATLLLVVILLPLTNVSSSSVKNSSYLPPFEKGTVTSYVDGCITFTLCGGGTIQVGTFYGAGSPLPIGWTGEFSYVTNTDYCGDRFLMSWAKSGCF